MDNDKTCSTCRYHRTIPIWETVNIKFHELCCKDELKDIDLDDTCDDWKERTFNKD